MADEQEQGAKETTSKLAIPSFPVVRKQQVVATNMQQDSIRTNEGLPSNQEPSKGEDNRWNWANTIAVFGLFINLGLAWLTYHLWMQAVNANKTSRDAAMAANTAAQAAKESNSLTTRAIILSEQTAKENREFTEQSLELTKKSLGAQISTLQEAQNQFILTNKPYLQIVRVRTNPANIQPNKIFYLNYNIQNYGQLPASIFHHYKGVYYCHKDDLPAVIKDPFNFMKIRDEKHYTSVMVAKESIDTRLANFPIKFDEAQLTGLLTHDYAWFFYGRMYYTSPLNENQVYEYKYIIKLIFGEDNNLNTEFLRNTTRELPSKEGMEIRPKLSN